MTLATRIPFPERRLGCLPIESSSDDHDDSAWIDVRINNKTLLAKVPYSEIRKRLGNCTLWCGGAGNAYLLSMSFIKTGLPWMYD